MVNFMGNYRPVYGHGTKKKANSQREIYRGRIKSYNLHVGVATDL